MRRPGVVIVMLAVAGCGCTKSDPQRPPTGDGDSKSASTDAQEQTMASVTLRTVTTQPNQPSDAVGWGPDGVVTADGKGVVSWSGDAPGTQVPIDRQSVGSPKSISFLPGGEVGVAAARLDKAGALIGNQAKLDAALVHGLAGISSFDYTIRTAAWSSDGSRLWLSAEKRSRKRSRDARRPTNDAPNHRELVLDADYRVLHVIDDATAWQVVVGASDTVVTMGGPLSIWPSAGATAARAQVPGPPVGIAISSDGGTVAAAEIAKVRLWSSDGAERATWDAQPTISLMAIAVATGGEWVATGDGGGVVRLWKVASTTTAAAEVTLGGQIQAIAFSPTGDRLVVGSAGGTVTILAIDGR